MMLQTRKKPCVTHWYTRLYEVERRTVELPTSALRKHSSPCLICKSLLAKDLRIRLAKRSSRRYRLGICGKDWCKLRRGLRHHATARSARIVEQSTRKWNSGGTK